MTKGDIFTAELNGNGSQQSGLRPVVIVQNDIGNTHSPTTIIACITTKHKKPKQPTHVSLDNHHNVSGQILCEQLYTINKQDLHTYIGHLTDNEQSQVDNALKVSLGLIDLPQKE